MATAVAEFGAVQYTIDGVGLPLLADAWVTAPDPVAARTALDTGAAVIAVLDASVVAGTTWAFGPPVLLTGLALAAARRGGYVVARPLAWLPMLSGGVTVVAGLVTCLLPTSEPVFLTVLAAGAVSAVWLVVLGVALWPLGRRSTDHESTVAAADR